MDVQGASEAVLLSSIFIRDCNTSILLPPSLVPMLWRYSARPYDRTGKNPEVLIGFFAKTF
jgi:hypothetical protein